MKTVILSPPFVGEAERAAVEAAFESNYVAPCGPMVDNLEELMVEVTGLPYTLALSSATAGLHLLYQELGVERGSVVVAPTLTFVASVAPAVQLGAEVVFVDSDPQTWMLDPALTSEALKELRAVGRHVAAVVAVDLYGQCCDYDELEKVCATYNVPLIIDGLRLWGRRMRESGGAAGVAAPLFNGNKIHHHSGGGVLASRNSEPIKRGRHLSQQPEKRWWYEHTELGYNYRMSNIVAAIGVAQLARLEEFVARRREVFSWYRERLSGCSMIEWMPEAEYGVASRWLSVAQIGGELGQMTVSGRPGTIVERVWQALRRSI